MENKDRHSRKPGSSVNAPAKKGGAGGSYTWGDSMDVPEDYQPVGQQAPAKVTTDAAQAAPPSGPQPQEQKPIATGQDQFPLLSPADATEVRAPASVPGPWARLSQALLESSAPGPWARLSQALLENDMTKKLDEQTKGVRGKAVGVFASAKARVGSAVEYVQGVAKNQVGGRIASATAAMRGATAQVVEYVDFARGTVKSNIISIQKEGVRAWVSSTAMLTTEIVQDRIGQARAIAGETAEKAKERAAEAAQQAKAKAAEVATSAKEVAMDKSAQSTAAAAAGGAVALGTAGGATGLATGTVVGAAIGLVPALFTFGLSIPIGAAIGGGTGLVAGAAAGSAVGAVGGGAAGYGAYAKREQIAGVATQTMAKVNDSAEYVKGRAHNSVDFVREKASVVRARLVGGGTGGTEAKE